MTTFRNWNYTWTHRITDNTRGHTESQPTHVDTQNHSQHTWTHRITANTSGHTESQPTQVDTQNHSQKNWTHRITTNTRGHTGPQPTHVDRPDYSQNTCTHRITANTRGHTGPQPTHVDTQNHSQHTDCDIWLNVNFLQCSLDTDSQDIIHRVSYTSGHFSEVGSASLQQEADEEDGPPSISELLSSDCLTTGAI